MDARAREIIDQWNRLDADRGTWKNHWQQISELCLPERNDYTVQRTPGMKRNQKIFDATPVFALQQFANGLHSYLTSSELVWFALHDDNERVDRITEVRAWFDIVTDVMYSIFNGPRHNFASQSHEYYLDLGSIGSACMAVLEGSRTDVLFSTRHLKECVFIENDEDRVDGVIRRWKWTAKQAVQNWGLAAVGAQVAKAYEDGRDTGFHFLHKVAPRKDRNPDRQDALHKPFESVYIGEQDGNIIAESGFDEFPYLPARFSKTAGEVYGRGPGMTMLPDMKMLNEMMKTVIKAAQKVVDPPLQIPDDGYLLPIKTVPGSQNFYRSNMPQTARISAIQTNGRIDIGNDLLFAMRQQIIKGFYVDWMMMPADMKDPASAGKGVTATWVLQQRDEKMRMLSPMLARLQSEFLGPLIDRTFGILWKKSVARRFGQGAPFPPPPAVLQGRRFHVEYLSPIAVAQRSSQLDSVGRLLQQQLLLKNLDPASPTIIDPEAIMRLTGRDVNAPAAALKSPERLQQEAQQAAEAQQQINGPDAAGKMAGALKDVASAHQQMSQAM